MADKKSQHYVPQFYLRGFSLEKSDRLIALYNIPTDTYVPCASIKKQACRDNFYKSLMIEDSLAVVEGAASTIIRDLITKANAPTFRSQERYSLLLFCLFQAYRTPWKAEEANELTDKVIKLMASGNPVLQEHLDEVEAGWDNPVGTVLKKIAFAHHVAYDLRFKVLVNETAIPFITSDNPAILYNQFLERRDKIGGHTGLAVKGLQLLLPLSPRLCLMFFDEKVYRVGGKRLTHIFEQICEHDVYQLNYLQAASAYENLYFSERCSAELVRKISRKALQWRRDNKAQVDTYVDSAQNTLCHAYSANIRTGLNLTVVEELPSAKGYQLGDRVTHLRNPLLCKLHHDFIQQVEQGKYKLSQFGRFILENIGLEEARQLEIPE